MVQISDAYIAYDLKLTVQLDSGLFVNGLTLLGSSTVTGPSCNSSISMLNPSEVFVSSLGLNCVAEVHLEAVVSC